MRIGRINKYSAEKFDQTKDAGLKFIEICCNDADAAAAVINDKDSIKEQIARTGIDVSSVGRWNHDLQENGVVNAEKAQQYADLMEAAIEIGAKTFVCGINKDSSISLYQNYVNAIAFFKSLVERANGRIKVAIQNCDWNNFVVSPKEWEVVLGEIPELCLKYDASHAYNRRADYLAEMSEWGDRIAHFHIKGTTHAGRRNVDDPPAGMDDLQWGSIFSILYARGYDGDLSIEPHSKTWRGDLGEFGVQFSMNYIQKFIYEK